MSDDKKYQVGDRVEFLYFGQTLTAPILEISKWLPEEILQLRDMDDKFSRVTPGDSRYVLDVGRGQSFGFLPSEILRRAPNPA